MSDPIERGRTDNSRALANASGTLFGLSILLSLVLPFLGNAQNVFGDYCCNISVDQTTVFQGGVINVNVFWNGNPNAPNYPPGKAAFARLEKADGTLLFLAYDENIGTDQCDGYGRWFQLIVPPDLQPPVTLRVVAGLFYLPSMEIYCGTVFDVQLIWPAPPACPNELVAPLGSDKVFVQSYAPSVATSNLTVDLPNSRYVGPTHSTTSTLTDFLALRQRGLVSDQAILKIAYCGVSCSAAQVPTCPDRFEVTFNGYTVTELNPSNPPFLSPTEGAGAWGIEYFQIPMEFVRFPSARGIPGALPPNDVPTPVNNRVTIVNSTTKEARIGWVSLDIGAISPVVLIHGNNSNSGIFGRQQFTNVLSANYIPWDASIELPTDTVNANAQRLKDSSLDAQDVTIFDLPDIAKSFGVDSIHLVAHSKGGLDARRYLQMHQAGVPTPKPEIPSLTTLGTPHNGSLLADIGEANFAAVKEGFNLAFAEGFPFLADYLTEELASQEDLGRANCTIGWCQAFNRSNVISSAVILNVLGSDADRNNNGRIDDFEYINSATYESEALRDLNFRFPTITQKSVDAMYQILRRTSAIKIKTFRLVQVSIPNYYPFPIRVPELLTPVPAAPLNENDFEVTTESATGAGLYLGKTMNDLIIRGVGNGLNHANVAGYFSALQVWPWVLEAEQQHPNGDL